MTTDKQRMMTGFRGAAADRLHNDPRIELWHLAHSVAVTLLPSYGRSRRWGR